MLLELTSECRRSRCCRVELLCVLESVKGFVKLSSRSEHRRKTKVNGGALRCEFDGALVGLGGCVEIFEL